MQLFLVGGEKCPSSVLKFASHCPKGNLNGALEAPSLDSINVPGSGPPPFSLRETLRSAPGNRGKPLCHSLSLFFQIPNFSIQKIPPGTRRMHQGYGRAGRPLRRPEMGKSLICHSLVTHLSLICHSLSLIPLFLVTHRNPLFLVTFQNPCFRF